MKKSARPRGKVPALGDQLKAIVKRRRLSARELSRLSGKDATICSRFLGGERDVTLKSFEAFALGLRLGLVELDPE